VQERRDLAPDADDAEAIGPVGLQFKEENGLAERLR
jgi:hypothetical protein